MGVNPNASGSRLLAVLECIAENQPVGVRQLARLANAEKSAVQRAIVTLASSGWIQTVSGEPTRWELSGRILHIAHRAHGRNPLRQRARPFMQTLAAASGETISLSVPDQKGLLIVDVAESAQPLRMVPSVGTSVSFAETASGRAILAYLDAAGQEAFLGEPVSPALLKILETGRHAGCFTTWDERSGGSVNIAAPIFEAHGRPVAAVLLSAPLDRSKPEDLARFNPLVLQTSRELSVACGMAREALPPLDLT